MKQALLIIDAQQELIDGNKEEDNVFDKKTLLNNINLTIEKALISNSMIIFIRDKDVASGRGDGFQIHQDIKIPNESKIFDKEATNSFYGTPLLSYLTENEIEHLVIMGCQTEQCIDTAVRTATINGFDVTLVRDGHSTKDSSTLSAQQIIMHHNEILDGHYNVEHFSDVRSAQEDLFQPRHNNYR
ncbi:isochorismatase family protein [Priestia megaterium]|jgi:nicotinamidase-related amidase|uniref:Isochorismatase family protein n=1 Tax=Priestia megaterium (strain ATCC 14581 / DSM 32 / CCUG 1817 / JCM 2506 / NBRC 15308 / NCIMB 9376 / NCTC 10342 / NRRL B-14308 / VKM B-512 / Ford 19) TaxID=1348623 RepID=A0A0B6AUJ7_PRIM2|nr:MULTISPECIES: isochorismatase family protein [Priestia]AJI24363.1 isochorismatase family protein [Priestia megaterium NBRC 15308 = ATCC 14581]KFN06104.1 isochorismatase family protein [Priestia megaterium]KGJ81195.1 isochorismatase [Priestia megaterium NBRC 15308 = ATCC 14581]MBU8753627.1 isochorismatase family protein [Priestia megaterium]MCU7709587.1 isochorismatase family protein [Priestia megaterium]